jgi:hypothetical protein
MLCLQESTLRPCEFISSFPSSEFCLEFLSAWAPALLAALRGFFKSRRNKTLIIDAAADAAAGQETSFS